MKYFRRSESSRCLHRMTPQVHPARRLPSEQCEGSRCFRHHLMLLLLQLEVASAMISCMTTLPPPCGTLHVTQAFPGMIAQLLRVMIGVPRTYGRRSAAHDASAVMANHNHPIPSELRMVRLPLSSRTLTASHALLHAKSRACLCAAARSLAASL